MFVLITVHAEQGHCLLKGNLQREIRYESRAGLASAEPTSWLCLDLDGLNLQTYNIEDVLTMLDIPPDASYILQYSASQGIKPGTNAHIFVLVDRPVTAEHAKAWLKHKNLTLNLLKEQLTLTKSQMALHWPLDITVCQNDKLLYIAPPTLSGRPDPVDQRINYINRGDARLHLGEVPSGIDGMAKDRLRQLRSAAGLKDHPLEVKYYKTDKAEIMVAPDVAAVTGVKRNGPFTYLNLNGGDSWGYFFQTARPALLHNFKGEPTYRLQEIAPSFFEEAETYAREMRREAHRPMVNGLSKKKTWVINRVDEGRYYKVIYNPGLGVDLHPAPSMKHIEDFCLLNKIPIPDAIEDWKVEFDPRTTAVVDTTERKINTYQPTIYRSRSIGIASAETKRTDQEDTPISDENKGRASKNRIPNRYWDLIVHVCGNDQTAARRFVNWLSFIWQTGTKPETAWIFHGTYGTGKGKLLKVLEHLFGKHCVVTGPEAVSEQFNADIEEAQILWIDEVTTDSWDSAKVTPKLRNWITDNPIKIRKMRQNAVAMPNYMGLIIAGNEYNIVVVRNRDRRFNVPPRQEIPLLDLPWATDEVLDNTTGWLYQEDNLTDLGVALQLWQVDVAQVRAPMNTVAKYEIMQVTQSLPEDIVDALNSGRVSFFLNHVPPPGGIPDIEGTEYKAVVEKMMQGGRVPLRTREIQAIFAFLAGWKQRAGKFGKAVARYGLPITNKTVREGTRTFAGMAFNFLVTDEDREFWTHNTEVKLGVVDSESTLNSGRRSRADNRNLQSK
jgi:hypothetical protein